MQQLEDLKEKIIEQSKSLWGRVQETSVYLDLKERFDVLPSKTQRLVLGGGLFVGLLIVFSFPLTSLLTSAQNMTFFEESRVLTQELMNVEREMQNVSQLPTPPSPSVLRSQVQNILQQAQLTEEQILALENMSQVEPQNVLPSNVQAQGLRVRLSTLNIRQITDLGRQMESQLGSGVKIWSVLMTQNGSQPEYFDVEYQLVSFSVAAGSGGGS